MKDNEVDKLRYHSLYVYNDLCRDEQRREILRFVAMVMMAAAVAALIIFLSGCGGGTPVPHTTPPVVTPDPPPSTPPPPPSPPPPITIPKSYAMSVLEPLPGFTDAQAEAINTDGTIVGYSVNNSIPGPDGVHATIWNPNGSTVDLGAGYAQAVNQGGEVVGYIQIPADLAYSWSVGPLQPFYGYDSSQALGVDDDGTIVGVCYSSDNPSHQQGVKWIHGQVFAVDALQTALGIHQGTIVGIDHNNMAATDQMQLGIGGAASAVSDAGITGYTFGALPELLYWSQGVLKLPDVATIGAAINATGIIVGQVLDPQENVRQHISTIGKPRFVGTTTAMAWTPADDQVDLNARTQASGWMLVFATGISDSGSIVGAAINQQTQQTAGFLLEAK